MASINEKNKTIIINSVNEINENLSNKKLILEKVNQKAQKENRINMNWQKDCISKINDSNNVILSAPTGSGKTKVFLEWAKNKDERPIYITAPIKALSNQRWRELTSEGYTVGLETGDIKNVPENCDFICCTQEVYTNKYAEDENATLIIDEFHYIFENPDRARTYIDALHNSKAKNILLCSATLGNVKKLKDYVEGVSGRKFQEYEGKSRLTNLKYVGRINPSDIKSALVVVFSKENVETILQDLSRIRKDRDNETQNDLIDKNAKDLKIDNPEIVKYAKEGLAGYYGELLPKEKLFIEKCFEDNLIDTVVGTDSLAMGVNFPVDKVVFAQLAKFYENEPISKNLFDQLAGRAGRKGYGDEGQVGFCDKFRGNYGRSIESSYFNTEDLYYKLLLSDNENIKINLSPNIKQILLGNTTIEKEVDFVTKYSTIYKEPIDVENNLRNTIEFINCYSNSKKFRKNIGNAYFDEYNAEKNCAILNDIIENKSLDDLCESYGKSFRDLLTLREYLMMLPQDLRKSYNLKEVDDKINGIDDTVLNIGREDNVSTSEINDGTSKEQKAYGEIRNALKRFADNLGIAKKHSATIHEWEDK